MRTDRLCLAALLVCSSSAVAQTGTFLDRSAATNLRIGTYNIYNDSIINGTRRDQFARVAAAAKPDVWSFQEFYNTSTADILALLNDVQPAAPGRAWSIYRPTNNEHIIASQFSISLTRANTTPAGFRSVAMGLIDLPNDQFATDLYLMNAHYKCCGGFDADRQKQSDAFVNWMRDARTSGGSINLAPGTSMMVMGDFNLVDGPQPLTTLLDGNIIDNTIYGADSAPDWDGSTNTMVDARQNAVTGGDTWTWRSDGSGFNPSRLDYITYTDSVMSLQKSFVLNSFTMTAADRAATGLQAGDTALNASAGNFDHLPVFADFAGPLPGDLDRDLDRDATDIDALFATVNGATNAANWRADVLRDGAINRNVNVAGSDIDQLVKVLLNTKYGDINLDGNVSFPDLLTLAQNYGAAGGWAKGNFNGDALIDFADLLVLAQNYGGGALTSEPDAFASVLNASSAFAADWSFAQSLVPEPTTLLLFMPVATRRRRPSAPLIRA